VIELRDIKKTYITGEFEFQALNGINLSIKPNDYIALMGSSGSGKSTLMNIIGALDVPTSGEYLLRSKPIHELDDNQISEFRNEEIGFVFQTFNLLPKLSALDNVALPLLYANNIEKEQRTKQAKEMMELVGLGDKLTNKPNELSGGQRQRVAIARALVNKPSLILADEPTGNLDSKTSASIMELFANLHNNGQTIILVTHEKEISEYAKKTIVLKDGIIIE
jgi:putative ABC transport system ATP-binding protein|tara:strand:+ start:26641 stop:27306 length:666 start_codon:yes stop_codon:yes gene_type:complete